MPEIQEKKDVYDLAFGVHTHGDNLFSAKIIKLKNHKITEWKHGTATTLGHAIAIAENLMGGYAVCAHEKSAENYYNDVQVI